MADNLSAVVKDGEIQSSTASQISLSKAKEKGSPSALDKDAFLQLLVAQMKYQDPLEPTQNTEYVSQLATFSSLEEMQNLNAGMTLQRASGLVGETVLIKAVNSATGGTEYAQGMVDYVVYENNKAFVSVNDSLYSIDDVYQVVDQTYQAAYDTAQKFMEALNSLPKVENITLGDSENIENLRTVYNNMNSYGQSFLPEGTNELLTSYVNKIHQLKLAEEAASKTEETENTTEKVEG
ncbi:MAG: flagellar hook capping protein [Lachnospiraceae bacterium]|nr:flagellar hook capping protein [Lachnospiraceae bacterium]